MNKRELHKEIERVKIALDVIETMHITFDWQVQSNDRKAIDRVIELLKVYLELVECLNNTK